MRESRRALRAAAGLLAVIALGSLVVSSATTLGGVSPQDLGAASGQTQQLEQITLDWTPTWTADGWRADALAVTAVDRGFRSGDEVLLTIAGAQRCELRRSVTAASATVSFDSAALTSACGSRPAIASASTIAVSVTGADTITTVSDLGALDGSVAGFAGPVTTTADPVTATRSTSGRVQVVTIDVPSRTPAALSGASAVVTASSGTQRVGTATIAASGVSVTARGTGSRVSIDVTDKAWTVSGAGQLDVTLSAPQRLDLGVSTVPGVVVGVGTLTALSTGGNGGSGSDGGGGETGGGGTGGGGTTGDGLKPVAVSAGLSYSYLTPWTGVQTNKLTFCHSFTVTNTTNATIKDWTVQFNTKLAPMWGMNPTTPGTVTLSNISTVAYDAGTGYWTVGGANDWVRTIEARGARVVQFCATSVPLPTPDPSLYTAKVTMLALSDYYVTFQVQVTSTSRYYVPWQVEIDMASLVCPASLQGHPLSFQRVTATNAGTVYTIRGTEGDTQLVSSSHSRTFTFATYSPGPGWRLPCSNG